MTTRTGKGSPVSVDSIGSSPLWKTYTTDGATDFDFKGDGGGPTRAIRVDTAGVYILTTSLPNDGSDTPSTDTTPFQAGETQNIQATKLTGSGSASGAKVTAYW